MSDGNEAIEQAPPDSIQIKALGVQVNAAGQKVVITVIACALVMSFGYFLYMHNQEMEAGNRAMLGELKVMTYMISLPQNERDKLRLDMPESLRSRLHKRPASLEEATE